MAPRWVALWISPVSACPAHSVMLRGTEPRYYCSARGSQGLRHEAVVLDHGHLLHSADLCGAGEHRCARRGRLVAYRVQSLIALVVAVWVPQLDGIMIWLPVLSWCKGAISPVGVRDTDCPYGHLSHSSPVFWSVSSRTVSGTTSLGPCPKIQQETALTPPDWRAWERIVMWNWHRLSPFRP